MLPLVTVIVFIVGVGTHPTPFWRHRIIGGQDATIEEYPYQVAIETEFETFLCGGSIISDKFIVSAAHPFAEQKSVETEYYVARVGSSSRQKKGTLHGFSSEQIVIHPNYGDELKFDYDVAVIKLDNVIQLGPTAATIQLIPKGEEIKDGVKLIVTGYGQTSFDGTVPENLQVAKIPKRNPDACTVLADVEITERMLCAGAGTPTTFYGDSGGPLTITITGQRRLAGLVSWGKPKPGKKDPVVFTNIANPSIHTFITEHSNS